MKKYLLIAFLFAVLKAYPQKTIHVYVALCDNLNQGIVPVPKELGNGQDPRTNLYWGALYGVKTHFKKSKDWIFVKEIKSKKAKILERVLFKHNDSDVYLLAEAYDGKHINTTINNYLESLAGNHKVRIKHDNQELGFAKDAELLAYIGHNGLMEFSAEGNFNNITEQKKDAIILACYSKSYFSSHLENINANPLVWSTGLMSPEAYTLAWALEGWVQNESDDQIRERAAKAYNHYQKCGLNGAKRLLVTGF